MKLTHDHWLFKHPIAHRGLHTAKFPENTFSAFANAIKHKHPIELDIQMLKDGQIVVFHDEDLNRLCGEKVKLNELNLKQIKKYKIGTTQFIPTLDEALKFINSRVPVLIEVKNLKTKNNRLHENLLAILKNQNTDFALQSFNPFTVRYFKQNLPSNPIGLLSGSLQDTQLSLFKKWYLKNCIDTFITRPDFISYEWNHLDTFFNKIHTRRGIPFICWTIRSASEKKQLPTGLNYIFDEFC